ncbi:zinc-ribbon domain-containing protein [Bacteriovoracaceae bacterium]|nr:zinc-ribbon domain-containing protein [Bacteriovoracaceae bacterium]
MRKYTIEDLKAYAKTRNGVCVSKEYNRAHDKYLWECNLCNHRWEASWANVGISKNHRWCPKCAGQVVTWKDVLYNCRLAGFKPLFKWTEYTKNNIKMKFECLTCHEISLKPYSSIQQNKKCDLCARQVRGETRRARTHTIKELKDCAAFFGGDCLEKKYLGVDEKHLFKCKKGHEFNKKAYEVFRLNEFCGICSGYYNRYGEMEVLAAKRKGCLLSTEYIKMDSKYDWECNLKHQFSMTYNKVLAGQWCSVCSSGLYERISRAAVEQIFSTSFPKKYPVWLRHNNRQLELDGYSEELGIAFEHHGKYHYTETSQFPNRKMSLSKRQEYDHAKEELCRVNNVKLIIIPELTTMLPLKKLKEYLLYEFELLDIKISQEFIDLELNFDQSYIALDKLKELKERLAVDSPTLILLSKSYLGMNSFHQFRCKLCGEVFEKTAQRSISSKNCCPGCKKVIKKNK